GPGDGGGRAAQERGGRGRLADPRHYRLGRQGRAVEAGGRGPAHGAVQPHDGRGHRDVRAADLTPGGAVDEPAALEPIAADAVERARAAGADHAEALVESGRAFTVKVSDGEIETLKQSVTHGLGLRVIVNGAVGFVSTNEFRAAALDDLVRRAVALARFSTPDPANGLPARADNPADGPADELALPD